MSDLNRTLLAGRDGPVEPQQWSFVGVSSGDFLDVPKHAHGWLGVHVPGSDTGARVRVPCLWGHTYLGVGQPLLLATVTDSEAGRSAIVPVSSGGLNSEISIGSRLRGIGELPNAAIVRLHHVGTVAGSLYRNLRDPSVCFDLLGKTNYSRAQYRKLMGVPNIVNSENFLRYTNAYYEECLPSITVFVD